MEGRLSRSALLHGAGGLVVGVMLAGSATPALAVPATPVSGNASLMTLLPAQAEIPDGLVEDGRRARSLAEVTQGFAQPAAAIRNFQTWGWIGNVICSFSLPKGTKPRSGMLNGVYVSIHEFTNADGARQGLDYALEGQKVGQPLHEAEVGSFGDYTRGLYGLLGYGYETTILTQQGSLFIRVSAAMLDGDPTAKTQAIMAGILART
ncbi:MAG: hypothetical protein WBA46_00645 [Thermomicrobiales bacterium]